MATVLPPPNKKQRIAAEKEKVQEEENSRIPEGLGSVRIQFVDQASGRPTGAPVAIPVAQANVKNLELLLNSLQGQGEGYKAEKVPYRFAFQPDFDSSPVNEYAFDIISDIYHAVIKQNLKSTEDLITLQYTPQAVFRVRAVTRCSASINGHGEAILAMQFSPATSSRMVSGSGDATARIWDCDTGTPFQTLKGHTSWVLAVAYSPDGSTIATGGMDNTVRLWNAQSGQAIGGPLRGHHKYITSLAWEPYHLQTLGRPRVASASKDASVRVWDVVGSHTDINFTRHQGTVSCVKWGGTGNIYTSSHDKTVKIWDSRTGLLLKTLTDHAHWCTHLALSTDFVLRTGYHDHTGLVPETTAAKQARAYERFDKGSKIAGRTTERLITASEDCTIFLWDTNDLSKPVARLLGHQKGVNFVTFSPDGHYIASCGFDNHVKLWMARDGKFVKTLRGHVAPVYQCCFSGDSRLLVSASKDTTIKAWDVKTGALLEDLPGHKDEVFAIDWSPDGKRVGSGGKDKAPSERPLMSAKESMTCRGRSRHLRRDWIDWNVEDFFNDPQSFDIINQWEDVEQVHQTADRYFKEFGLEGYYDEGAFRKQFRDKSVDRELELHEQVNNTFVGSPHITKSAFQTFEREFNKTKVPKEVFGRAVLGLPREQLDSMIEHAKDRRNRRKLVKATTKLARDLRKTYAEQHPAAPKVSVKILEKNLSEYHDDCQSFQADWEHILKMKPDTARQFSLFPESDESKGSKVEDSTMGEHKREGKLITFEIPENASQPTSTTSVCIEPERFTVVPYSIDQTPKQVSVVSEIIETATKPTSNDSSHRTSDTSHALMQQIDGLHENSTGPSNKKLLAVAVAVHEQESSGTMKGNEIMVDIIKTKDVDRGKTGDSHSKCGTNEGDKIKMHNVRNYEVKEGKGKSRRDEKRETEAMHESPISQDIGMGCRGLESKQHRRTQLEKQARRKTQRHRTACISHENQISPLHYPKTNSTSIDRKLHLTDRKCRATKTTRPEQGFANAEMHEDPDVTVKPSESTNQRLKARRERPAEVVVNSQDNEVSRKKSNFANPATNRGESFLNTLATSVESSALDFRSTQRGISLLSPSREDSSSSPLGSVSSRTPAVPCFELSSSPQDSSKPDKHSEVRLSAPLLPLTATVFNPPHESAGLVNLSSRNIPSKKDKIENRRGAEFAHGLATPCGSLTGSSRDEPREADVLVQLEKSQPQQVDNLVESHKTCDNDMQSNVDDDDNDDDEINGDAHLERIYNESTSNNKSWPDHLPIIRRVRKAKIGLRAYVQELRNGKLKKYESWMYAQFDSTGPKLNVTRAFEAHCKYEELLKQASRDKWNIYLSSSCGNAVQDEDASVPIEDKPSNLEPLPAVPENVPIEQKCADTLFAHDRVTSRNPIPPMSRRRSETTSKFFESPSPTKETTSPKKRLLAGVSCIQFPPLSAKCFGLIQETLADNPFQLIAAVMFLNKTKGTIALPVFWKLMDRWPTPSDLAAAEFEDVLEMIQHLGLQNLRATKLIGLAKLWLEDPPVKGRRHRTMHYPERHAGKGIQIGEILDDGDERLGAWEIAHLPGCGDYACDSWRIFCRDKLRGVAEGYQGEGADARFEPEWKRVLPGDKELRAFLRWMWLREGWEWNPETGENVKASQELMENAERGNINWEEWERSKNRTMKKAKVESKNSPEKLILTPSTRVASKVSNTDQHTPLTRSMMVPRRSERGTKRTADGPLEALANRPGKKVRTGKLIQTLLVKRV